jgi:hypothetical protein
MAMKTVLRSLVYLLAMAGAMSAQSISSVTPNNGIAGCQVTITGSGFSTTASENQVYFGKSKANVISVNSTGTELVVNTPTNPSFPSQIAVLNTNTNEWLTSDLRFRFTYGARINPATRNIQQQYQSQSVPSSNLVTHLGRTSLGFRKGPFLVKGDYTDDGATDIFLQSSNNSSFNSVLTPQDNDNGIHTLLINNNPTFQYTANGNGFNTVSGVAQNVRTSDAQSDIPHSEILQTSVLSADLNNDGTDEVIVYGSRQLGSYAPTLAFQHQPGFFITEFVHDGSSNVVTAESLTNKNIFTVTSSGGIDYHGWSSNQSNGATGLAVIQNTGDKLLLQTSILGMKASDIDGDGDLDLVALLSWPLLRFAQGNNARPARPQIYVFENTTSQGSNTFTFNSSTYNDGSIHVPASNTNPGITATPKDANFAAHLGNFIGPDHVISLNNSTFTDYDIDRWISDLELADIDSDGDFDIIVKGIENLVSATNTLVDTTQANSANNTTPKMAWLYDANTASGLKAAATSDNGFLSWFENNSTSSGMSFTSETVIDGSVSNNGKYDWGGIDVNDIDNDGDLDIVISSPDNSSTFTATPDVSIYLQGINGSFGSPIILDGPSSPTSTQSTQGYVVFNLMCEDLNGDGLLDIALTGSNLGELYTYMRLPGTSSISASSYDLQKFNYTNNTTNNILGEVLDVSLADYSDDGKPDLTIISKDINGTASQVLYFKNNNGDPAVLTSGQLTTFGKCLNNASAAQEFTIGGINISYSNGHSVTASVTSDFEISLDSNSTYSSSVSANPDSYNDVAATKVYIRAKSSTNTLSFQGTLTISSNAASSVEFNLYGERRAPVGGTISPTSQYVSTTNTSTSAPSTSPAATATPVAITLSDYKGTIQWQKSTDNSNWSDISGATTISYTLPLSDIENEGLVYLRAKLTRCSDDAFSSVVTVIENLGAPAPPSLSPSNGQTIAGTFDQSLTTTLSLTDASGSVIATCSDLTNGCTGWTLSNGTFAYTPSPVLSDGAQVKAYALSNLTGTSLTSASSSTIVVDAVQPNAPVVNPSNGNSISGTAEAGSTVSFSYSVGGSTVTASVVADASGNYTFYPTSPLVDGTVVSVTSTDEVGNISTNSSVTVDATIPTITPALTNSTNDAIANGSIVSGTTEPGATVVATDSYGNTYSTTADAVTGSFSIDISAGTWADGDEVYVVSTDAAGNTSSIQTTTIDPTPPAANIYATNGTSFDGALDGTGYSVTVSYGSPATTQNATVTGSTFNWTPSSSLGLSIGDQITYTITDEVGNVTTYTTTVEAVAHCIPVHATGLTIGTFSFYPDATSSTSTDFSTYISDAFSDRSTDDDNIIQVYDDAKPKIEGLGTDPNQTSAYYAIWIDLNQDGDFDDTGEEVVISANPISLNVNSPTEIYDWSSGSAPFLNLPDGSEYIMRVGLSTTAAGVSDPCGSSGATANFQDLRIRVANCEDPASLTVAQASDGSAQLDVDFVLDEASMDITYVIAEASSPFDDPFNNSTYSSVDDWLSNTNNANSTTSAMTGVANGSGGYDYSFSSTTDSEGNTLGYGNFYAVAIKTSCGNSNWVKYPQQGVSTVELIDPNGPDYAGSDFAITSHTYTQIFQSDNTPDNTLNLPVGESLSVKTSVKGSDATTAVAPTVFNYFDVVGFQNFDPSDPSALPLHILGTMNSWVSTNAPIAVTLLVPANTNEVTYTTTPNTATSYWLTYTFKELATGDQPWDAYGSNFSNSVNVAWYEAPVPNSNGDGLTGAVPGETVTLVLDGTTYTALAGNDGTVALTAFTDGSNTLSSDAINALVNGSYTIDQSWTSGGSSFTHASPTQVLSGLSINAATNSVTGTAAPGASVTLTIGDETFTTTADATTGIYDFASTTSSTTSPSTGVAFSTLVPFTATTAYTINQSLSGYTSSANVTGSILAATSDIPVPTISGALALSGSSTTIAGTAEAGSQVYLYDEDGNQLFDANGDPITTTADNQGAYSITVDLSAAQISTGSNSFASAYTSPYTGEVIQVGTTDTDGNTAPLSAAFVNPSVYTSSGTWTDASGNSISTPSTSGAATSSSPLIRYESNVSLPSGISGYSGLELASGVTLSVPDDGCLDIAGSLLCQGTGGVSLGSSENNGVVQSSQMKFTGGYYGPPTFVASGSLFNAAHMIASPLEEGFTTTTGDNSKLVTWDGHTSGTYFPAGTGISTKGTGYFAVVSTNQFLATAGDYTATGSPNSSLTMDLGYVVDVYSQTSAGSGWNLIGNPYTCGWDWDQVSKTNLNGTFYIYDFGTSSFKYYTSGGTGSGISSSIIPPMQGIWVQTTGSGASISSTMSASGALSCGGSPQGSFFKSASPVYQFQLKNSNLPSDTSVAFIMDVSGATVGFDGAYDAWYLNTHLPSGHLYGLQGADKIAANAVDLSVNKTVDFGFESIHDNASYQIILNTDNPDTNVRVRLHDHYLDTDWILNDAPYSFQNNETFISSLSDSKKGVHRFTMIFENTQTSVSVDEQISSTVHPYFNGEAIFGDKEYFHSYQIYNTHGQLIWSGEFDGEVNITSLGLKAGLYICRLVGPTSTVALHFTNFK